MENIPKVKIGIVAVSRNCFPKSLSENRRKAVVENYIKKYDANDIFECPICIVESEIDMKRALKSINTEGCNALVVYLGNFGPEISETMIAQNFDGPVMFIAAAEESKDNLINGRGDAYCGLLNASYSLNLRKQKVYIPFHPVVCPNDAADLIHNFLIISRTIIALKYLKIISFGPRPNNFVACNAPIKGLYDLKIEIEENSELDLYDYYLKHENDKRIDNIVSEMIIELGSDCKYKSMLSKFAQYEATILDYIRTHKGNSSYVALTTRCWPLFQNYFGFVPCYVNSRLAKKGIIISCENDIYGALSEYIGMCVSDDISTILDINNSVPYDLYVEEIKNKKFIGGIYNENDIFMAYHCGNVSSCKLASPKLSYQKILANNDENNSPIGTMEGNINGCLTTMFRLQSTADTKLRAYIAEGEILPIDNRSYGSIGTFAIKNMDRFYRYVLIENNYPHHAAILFGHYGKLLFDILKMIGLTSDEIDTNLIGNYYKNENPYDLEVI